MDLRSLVRFIGRPLFRLLFSVEYHGLENIPETGAVIIAGNHPSYLDPALVGLPVDRVIKFMAWDALFRIPGLGWLIRALGAFPVDIRRGKGEAAYREACRVLENGYAMGIFPEGQRSERGPMGELRTGVARLAIDTGAPIVPVTVGGAFRAWPKYKLLPKPAKVIIRYHEPIRLSEEDRKNRRDDRSFQREVMQRVAASINRSLAPALRESEAWEKWYRQPPSHIRMYEWAPLAAAVISTFLLRRATRLNEYWLQVWAPVLAYYLYLVSDLTLIKPARLAKWIRNSAPIWLVLSWHYLLTPALGVPAGDMNLLLVIVSLGVFFTFFWEDYYTLQKFVRGLVVAYYFSLALLLRWPQGLGTFVTVLVFIITFSFWYKTVYYFASGLIAALSIVVAIFFKGPPSAELLLYAAIGAATVGYVQTFVSAAYDIRKNSRIVRE